MNSMQLKDKLRNISKEKNVDFNTLLRLYMYDRFIERLSVSKYKDNNTKIGIDISLWQGDIDFKKLKEAGVEFVIIRVGYMKGTNGERVLDSKFKQNIENANKNKIPVGVYYFSYASSKKEAIKDAKWVLKQIKK